MECNNNDFFHYFNENMNAIGLPAPKTLFSSAMVAVATITSILSVIDTLGHNATLTELAKATTVLEKLKIVSGVSGAYYAGAVVGSFCVATFKVGNCGASLLDVIAVSQKHNIYRSYLVPIWNVFPGVINNNPKRYVRPLKRHQYN